MRISYSNKNKNTIIHALKNSYKLLTKKEKKLLRFNIIFSFIGGLLEILSVTTFYPLVGIIIQPDLIQNNKIINFIWEIIGSPNQINFVIILSIFISITLIFSNLVNFLSQLSASRMSTTAHERLANDIFKNIIYVPYKWHLLNNPNVIRNIILNNLTLWNKNVIRIIPSISGQIAGILLAVVSLLIITPKVGFLLISFSVTLLTILLKFIRKKSARLMSKVREKEELINIFLTETLNGVKDIKVSSKESNFIKSFYKLNHIIVKNYAAASNWNLLPSYLVVLFGQLSILITASSLFILGVKGGDLASIMTIIVLVFSKIIPLLNRFGSSLNNIANVNTWIDKAIQTVENLESAKDELVNYQENKPSDKKIKWEKLNFSSVYFKYPNSKKFVFKDFNLEIDKGKHYAFVGQSGVGKSTAVDLLLGLLNPEKGKILIDGKDLIEVGIRKWQNIISYVPQEPFISNLSLRENVAFGIPIENIDDKKVSNCLKQTNLLELANSLPNGIYTNLGNQGISLSGGQKQRVAISRALYENVEILVLDEATSALDNESENIIKNTIKNLKKEITIISIAHRISTIKDCDCIFLIENGSVKSKGAYKNLLKKSSLFRKLSNSVNNLTSIKDGEN